MRGTDTWMGRKAELGHVLLNFRDTWFLTPMDVAPHHVSPPTALTERCYQGAA
jgi:hypothetical protein